MATLQFGSGGGFSWDTKPFPAQRTAVKHYLTTFADLMPPAQVWAGEGGRATPDVSGLGEGYQVVIDGHVNSVAGTSASTPMFAALISLINEQLLQSGKPALGFLNPFLYANADAFHDIVIGDNFDSPFGGNFGFNCTPGWDAVTGLGTPNFQKLLGKATKAAGVQQSPAAPIVEEEESLAPIVHQSRASAVGSLATPCTSDLTCSLNGACVSGVCVCDGGWQGAVCDELAIQPASRSGGLHNASMASWGGNSVFEGGKYHLFAAAMLNDCGLEAWGSNSYIVRAEADSVAGPFEPKETVLGPFAHNPTVRQLPDGSVLLYLIGDGSQRQPPHDCRNTTRATPAPVPTWTAPPPPPGTTGTGAFVAHAPSVRGPWELIEVARTNESVSDDLCSGWTNPSPHVMPDGSVTLAFQSSRCEPFPVGKHYVALIGLARARTWRGPYSLLGPNAVNKEQPWCVAGQAEDPFLWRSDRGWHLLMHGSKHARVHVHVCACMCMCMCVHVHVCACACV